jgi:hypothetical protein
MANKGLQDEFVEALIERVVEWLMIPRAAELCRSAGGASLPTQQLTDPATVIT